MKTIIINITMVSYWVTRSVDSCNEGILILMEAFTISKLEHAPKEKNSNRNMPMLITYR